MILITTLAILMAVLSLGIAVLGWLWLADAVHRGKV